MAEHSGSFNIKHIDQTFSDFWLHGFYPDEQRFDIEITRHFFRLRPRLAIPTLLRRPRYRKILGVKIASEMIILYNMKIDA